MLRVALLLTLLLVGPACQRAPAFAPATAAADDDLITQISVINALMLGQYDGVMGLPQLLRCGDFGLGTLDHLDGELTILDGQAYQVRGDGSVHLVGPERSTPFAVVTHFEREGELPCPVGASLGELEADLDRSLPAKNAFFALRVDGAFAAITLRSVHRQEPPFAPLAEVAKSQSVWKHENVRGTLVGIRCPQWTAGLNVPGYHWHFLSADRQLGGHVLACQTESGKIYFDQCSSWLIKLEHSAEFEQSDLGRDLRQEVDQVERLRDDPAATSDGDKK